MHTHVCSQDQGDEMVEDVADGQDVPSVFLSALGEARLVTDITESDMVRPP